MTTVEEVRARPAPPPRPCPPEPRPTPRPPCHSLQSDNNPGSHRNYWCALHAIVMLLVFQIPVQCQGPNQTQQPASVLVQQSKLEEQCAGHHPHLAQEQSQQAAGHQDRELLIL